MKGEVPKYEDSKSNAVYAIGALVIVMTFIYLGYTGINLGEFTWLNALNGILFLVIGIGLITINRSVLKALKDRETDAIATAAPIPPSSEGPVLGVPLESPRGKPIKRADSDIQVQVRLPITQQPSVQSVSSPPAQRRAIRVGCPKCKSVIIIDSAKKGGRIQCNSCGFTGNVG